MDEEEDQLLQALRRRYTRVTWEHVLTLPLEDPAWSEISGMRQRDKSQNMRAAAAGTFVGDVLLEVGAWNGVVLMGVLSRELNRPTAMQHFSARFRDKRPFHRLLSVAPQWILLEDDVQLKGAAAMVAHREKSRANFSNSFSDLR
jgi:glucokinase